MAQSTDPTLIGQKEDVSRPQNPAVAPPSNQGPEGEQGDQGDKSGQSGKGGKGRPTRSINASNLSLSFVEGLCAGRAKLTITKERTTIGRGEECDLVLDGETVSRQHCEIVRFGAVFMLEDSSRNGTYINDQRVSQAQLRNGDQLRIGQNYMLVHFSSANQTGRIATQATAPYPPPPAATAPAAPATPAVIELKPHIVVKGLEEGVTQPFSEDRITIGRRSDNHLVLDDDNISRQHVAIERSGGQYQVCDLGSANGTYLNDQRIDRALLSDGDRLRIGDLVMTISLLDQDCILNFKKIRR